MQLGILAGSWRGDRPDWRSLGPALAAVLIVALVLRLCSAGGSLWYDELVSLFFADLPLRTLWSDWMIRETNPPLYYSLLRGWIAVAGESNVAVRMPSIAGGLGAVLLIAAIAGRTYGCRAGLIAATLAAVSAQHLYYSLQVRPYILLSCAGMVATLGAMGIARDIGERRPTRAAWAAYVAGCGAALYLHSSALFMPVAITAAILLVRAGALLRRPAAVWPLVGTNALLVAVGAWELRIVALQLLGSHDNIAAIGLATPGRVASAIMSTLFLAKATGPFVLAAALPVAGLAGGYVVVDRARVETRFLAVLALTGIALLALVGAVVPLFAPRTVFWLSFIPVVLAAAMLARLRPGSIRTLAVAGLAALLTVNTLGSRASLVPEDWDGALRTASQTPGALFLVTDDGTAVAAQTACRRLGPKCAVEIAAVETPGPSTHFWAAGLFARHVAIEELPRLSPDRPIYLFRKEFVPGVPAMLRVRGMGRNVVVDGPPLLGPYRPIELR